MMNKQIIPANNLLINRNIPALKDNDIHVWSIDINEAYKSISQFQEALTDIETKRSNFFEFNENRNSYIISQGSLKLLLSNYLNIPTKQLKIGRHRKGKPFSEDDKSLFFNISISGTKCMLAFGRHQEIGIDLEMLRKLPDLDELIDKNFNEKEKKYINADVSTQSFRFFQFWTMKESYLKAIGEGMRLTPDQIEFSIEREKIKLSLANGITDAEDWLFKKLEIDEGYIGTLSYLHKNTKITYYNFPESIQQGLNNTLI